MAQPPGTAARLPHFPISLFAMVMGLGGLTLAWERAQQVFATDLHLAMPLTALSAAVFVVLLGFYLTKLVRHPGAVAQELKHPVKLNFFPTISISMLILAGALFTLNPWLASLLWWPGMALHLVFTLYVVNTWIHANRFQIQHINPAWFIPAVGNVLVPIAGVPLGQIEISWFFFSIGMLFWLVLMTIVFYRVLFHAPIDQRLMPTLFILIAPPAVGFLAYVRLVGELDAFGRVLYYSGLFLTLLMLTQAARFIRLGFFLSSWAYSFPLAAITTGSLSMIELTGKSPFTWIGVFLITLLSLVVIMLLVHTTLAIRNDKICVPDQ